MIVLEAVTKTYRLGMVAVEALKGIDLRVGKGESISIMGPSGSGKSTLMNIIGCLDRPTSGSYTLGGQRVDSLSEDSLAKARNKFVGFVFQTFNLLATHTAIENVELPLLYAGVRDPRPRAERALTLVGLGHRATHRPTELSGGERQRVAIARAIVNEPSIILADEPTGNLDSSTGREIMAVFKGLNEQGVTIVIVTHEPEIASCCNRTIFIKDGALQAQ
jgi:putative ABC transport system ATP-binding protein